jgi:hypothetical protein
VAVEVEVAETNKNTHKKTSSSGRGFFMPVNVLLFTHGKIIQELRGKITLPEILILH